MKCVSHGDVVGAVQFHPITEDVVMQIVATLNDAWGQVLDLFFELPTDSFNFSFHVVGFEEWKCHVLANSERYFLLFGVRLGTEEGAELELVLEFGMDRFREVETEKKK